MTAQDFFDGCLADIASELEQFTFDLAIAPTLILTEPDMDLVGQAEDGLKAVALARTENPDVILMDLTMPRMDGIEAIGEIKKSDPDVRILVLTSFSDDDHVFAAIKAGALGYVLKDIRPEELLQAIRDVHQGQSSLHRQIARKLIREINQPSDQPDTTEPVWSKNYSDRPVQSRTIDSS